MAEPSITFWRRFEPRPRSDDLSASLATEIRDPMWFIARQWQLAEFQGEDAASIAYVEYFGRVSKLPRWAPSGAAKVNVDVGKPLERQTLGEPIEPDLALRVELAQTFELFLEERTGSAADDVVLAFSGMPPYALAPPPIPEPKEFRPVDAATERFLDVCVGRALDGYQIYLLAKNVAGGAPVPDWVSNDQAVRDEVGLALGDLLDHVTAVFGEIGLSDPSAWTAKRLEYDLEVVAVDPGGRGNATLSAKPNSDGEYDWTSFDVTTKDLNAPEEAPEARRFTMIPADLRFPGIPNPRHWYFESNAVSYVDLKPEPTDIPKVLVADMVLIQGADWFVLPFDQAIGTAVRTDGIVVTDVFGKRMLVTRAETNDPHPPTMYAPGPGLTRWSMFSITDASSGSENLAEYFVLPLSAGPLVQDGRVLEDVRFGRDEMANMAWAVERVTESAIGEPRSGRERDAEIAAGPQPSPPTPEDLAAPLHYQIETLPPANWIPLIGISQDDADHPNDPTFVLEKGAVLRPLPSGDPAIVPSLGRLLAPSALALNTPYQIVEEEVPRFGLRLERTVSRTRWVDGTTHLWVSRRRHAGAGESQSGLRFDQALPNT